MCACGSTCWKLCTKPTKYFAWIVKIWRDDKKAVATAAAASSPPPNILSTWCAAIMYVCVCSLVYFLVVLRISFALLIFFPHLICRKFMLFVALVVSHGTKYMCVSSEQSTVSPLSLSAMLTAKRLISLFRSLFFAVLIWYSICIKNRFI